MMMYILIGAIAIGIGGMIFAVSLLFQGDNDQIEERLASLTQNGGRGASKSEAAPASLLRSPLDDAPNMIEEFVTRDGTDYGAVEQGVETRVAQVEAQLRSGEARIVFDPDSGTANIVLARDLAARRG